MKERDERRTFLFSFFFVWFSFDFPFLSSYFPSPSQGVLVYSIDVFLFFLHFSHKRAPRRTVDCRLFRSISLSISLCFSLGLPTGSSYTAWR
jgi:hypothetical protein